MLFESMLFGLLVLGPLMMLLVFAIIRSERAMAALRRVVRPRPPLWPARSANEGEPE